MKKSNILYILALIAVAAACWYISNFHCQLLLIQGESMAPTYHSGRLVLIEKQVTEYKTGDIVLYDCDELGCNIVKRIAAVPGDTLHSELDTLYINGEAASPLPEEILRAYFITADGFTVPDGCYFLLGDNSAESLDSRYEEVGLAAESRLHGRVITNR